MPKKDEDEGREDFDLPYSDDAPRLNIVDDEPYAILGYELHDPWAFVPTVHAPLLLGMLILYGFSEEWMWFFRYFYIAASGYLALIFTYSVFQALRGRPTVKRRFDFFRLAFTGTSLSFACVPAFIIPLFVVFSVMAANYTMVYGFPFHSGGKGDSYGTIIIYFIPFFLFVSAWKVIRFLIVRRSK